MKKHEDLWSKSNAEISKMKDEFNQTLRTLRDEFDFLQDERDLLHAELSRFLAMPNPCGVGMALVESKKKDKDGNMVKSITVSGMQPGISADLSGIVRIGDELLQVNEFLSEDMQLAEVQEKVAGNRGTQIAFRFRRRIESGEHKGETFDYRIVLKRGAWGPEHCVMTPEDLDMVNEGRWPEQGSVSADVVNMAAITGGQDASLNYEGKDKPNLGLATKASGRPASSAGGRPGSTSGMSVSPGLASSAAQAPLLLPAQTSERRSVSCLNHCTARIGCLCLSKSVTEVCMVIWFVMQILKRALSLQA